MRVDDHPDIGLLTLCAQLRALQARWQVLWTATSDLTFAERDKAAAAGTLSLADRRFEEFSDDIWPGYYAKPEADPVRALLMLPATTLDGIQSKAGALRAISDAGGYTGSCRDDECSLTATFLGEIAGRFRMLLGEAAPSTPIGNEIAVGPPG